MSCNRRKHQNTGNQNDEAVSNDQQIQNVIRNSRSSRIQFNQAMQLVFLLFKQQQEMCWQVLMYFCAVMVAWSQNGFPSGINSFVFGNGGFESPNFNGGFGSLNACSTGVGCWGEASGNQLEIGGGAHYHPLLNSSQITEIDANSNNNIWQEFSMTYPYNCRLTFTWANRPGVPFSSQGVRITIPSNCAGVPDRFWDFTANDYNVHFPELTFIVGCISPLGPTNIRVYALGLGTSDGVGTLLDDFFLVGFYGVPQASTIIQRSSIILANTRSVTMYIPSYGIEEYQKYYQELNVLKMPFNAIGNPTSISFQGDIDMTSPQSVSVPCTTPINSTWLTIQSVTRNNDFIRVTYEYLNPWNGLNLEMNITFV